MPTHNRPITFDGNTHREMTDAEFEQYVADREAAELVKQAEAQKLSSRESAITKLTALGLTDAEVAALLGV